MIKVKFNTKEFNKTMNNVIDYSIGFLDGTKQGKKTFMNNLGESVKDMADKYIDAAARSNPDLLHHIYEWYRTGSPDARLFDIQFKASEDTINFMSVFNQSTSVQNGSNTPFFDKARIMESGVSVVIAPRTSRVLAFEVDGEQVFTPNPVRVDNPGGATSGQYSNIFNQFFQRYFSQAFLMSSGVKQKLENPQAFKESFGAGGKQGKAAGVRAGTKWITSIKVEVE